MVVDLQGETAGEMCGRDQVAQVLQGHQDWTLRLCMKHGLLYLCPLAI